MTVRERAREDVDTRRVSFPFFPSTPPLHQTAASDAAANTIFIRDRSIGVALEGVRAVVCADQVLVLAAPPTSGGSGGSVPPLVPTGSGGGSNAGPPAPNAPFVRDLVERVAGWCV